MGLKPHNLPNAIAAEDLRGIGVQGLQDGPIPALRTVHEVTVVDVDTREGGPGRSYARSPTDLEDQGDSIGQNPRSRWRPGIQAQRKRPARVRGSLCQCR